MQAQATPLERLTDDELSAMWRDERITLPELEAECDRRECETRARAVQRHAHAEWEDAAYAQYQAACDYCRGDHNMLSEAGKRTGRQAWPMLWQGGREAADKLASDELITFWDYVQKRIPGPGEIRDGRASATRAAHEAYEHEEAHDMTTTTTGGVHVPPSVAEDYKRHLEGVRAEHAAMVAGTALDVPKTGTVAVPPRQQLDAPALLRRGLEALGVLLTDHVEFKTRGQAVAVTTWLAQAAARNADRDPIWLAFPRLLITSQRNGSGKSTVGDISRLVLQTRAGRMSKVTPYGLCKVFGTYKETAILDDAQNVFRSDKAGAELLSIMVNGYTLGATWVSGKSDGKIEDASGSMMVVGKDALITKRAEDLADLLVRSVIVRLDRPRFYMPELNRAAMNRAAAIGQALTAVMGALAPDLEAAAEDLATGLVGTEVTDPNGPRTMQIWRPMLAVAKVAGGRWPEAVMDAKEELSVVAGDLLAASEALDGLEALSAALGTPERSFWADTDNED
jgi:hypothetical protein